MLDCHHHSVTLQKKPQNIIGTQLYRTESSRMCVCRCIATLQSIIPNFKQKNWLKCLKKIQINRQIIDLFIDNRPAAAHPDVYPLHTIKVATD